MNELMDVANSSHWLPPALINAHGQPFQFDDELHVRRLRAAVTIYYWWQNIKGIEESSDKALRVMQITTIMVVFLFSWGAYSHSWCAACTCLLPDHRRTCTSAKMRSGFLKHSGLPILGLFGIIMAFGHSILAMSGEETLAQVNREIQHPEAQESQARGDRHRHLQPRLHRRRNAAGVDADSGRAAHADLSEQPDCRPGDVHGRAACSGASPSASSSCSSDS